LVRCSEMTVDGRPCDAPALRGSTPPRCRLHTLGPEARREIARRASKARRTTRLSLKLPMKYPEDARTNSERVLEGVAARTISEREGRLMLRLIQTWLDAYRTEVVDFKAEMAALKEQLRKLHR